MVGISSDYFFVCLAGKPFQAVCKKTVSPNWREDNTKSSALMATSRCEGRLSQFVERSASKPILACVWGVRLQKDSKVYLYTGISINNKKGNVHYKQQLVEEPFRLIVGKSKQDPKKVFWFVTNDFELTAKQVADAYRRRWDIEVFFRFIKQELNVSHLVSLNKNGIQVILI